MKITVPYFGDLSCNNYKVVRNGRATITTKPEVKVWMAKLAYKVEYRQKIEPVDLSGEIIIGLWGHFRDRRIPDLSNLHKVTLDAISVGLGINDKFFRCLDLGVSTGSIEPTLDIYITEKVANLPNSLGRLN